MTPVTIQAASVLLVIFCFTATSAQTQVATKNGVIKGRIETVSGQVVHQFLGVPFAKPPLGELRFKKPQPAENFTGVKDTIEYGASCMQVESPGIPLPQRLSEDCLTLNVFVPNTASPNAKKAVMVWIYGGGYMVGGTEPYPFSHFAVQGDVIVVSINYRVGVFGFLSTGDVNAPGNAGLWDQIEGLKWVRDNINSFSGDPTNVTIFGESAGGGSVSQLAMTLEARGLFHRFISMSGTALSNWAWVPDALDVSAKLGQHLGCNAAASDNAQLLTCLRAASASVLNNATAALFGYFPGRVTGLFGPVVDGEMFPQSVEKMLMDSNSQVVKNFLSLDYMGGFTSSDGGVMLGAGLPLNLTVGLQPSVLRDSIIPSWAQAISAYHKKELEVKLKELYYDPNANVGETAMKYVDFNTDTMFASPTIGYLRYHLMATGGSTYLYYVTKEPSFGHLLAVPDWFRGVNHADELIYMMGPEASVVYNVTLTELERNLSTAFIHYFTNFAKTGNPNTPVAVPSPWPSYTYPGKEYLDFGDVITNKTGVISKRVTFWVETVPQMLARSTTPAPTATTPVSEARSSVVSTLLLFVTVSLSFLKLF